MTKLRWAKVEGNSLPTNDKPLAMIETWRQTQMGYVKEMTPPTFYKLQAKNESGEWQDIEISAEPETVTRYIGGKAVKGPR